MDKIILSKIPKKKTGDERNKFLFREEGGNFLIQGTHIIYILGDIEKDIYNEIDGKANVGEIINKISLKYNGSVENIKNDTIDFLNILADRKIIEIS